MQHDLVPVLYEVSPGDGRLDAACPEPLNIEILWFQFH